MSLMPHTNQTNIVRVLMATGFSLSLLTSGCATTQDISSTDHIILDKPVHFSAPDESDILATSGSYTIDLHDNTTLRLSPREAASSASPLLVAAVALPHEQPVESRVALSVPNGEDEHHVVLLLPDGKGLDAGGTYSGTRSRGTSIPPLPMAQLNAAFLQLGPVVRDHRTLPVEARPNDFDIAFFHAPIHYQDTDSSNYRADYITRFDYDGNMIATDNWDNLTKFPLPAHAYYSVVETCTHWFIAYGFFHPRDWTDSNFDQEHENDMEGLLNIVRKDGTTYGKLEGMVTVAHEDFYSFTPPGSPLRNGHENIDGTLTLQQYEGSWRPLTVQQAKGHGLKAFPYTSDFQGKPNEDGIIYFPSRTQAGVPQSGNDRHVNYLLFDLFAPGGLWQRQLDEAPLPRDHAQTFAKWGAFKGDKSGGCGGGMSLHGLSIECSTDSPHPPWGWDDHDDGSSYAGEMALDPAHLTAHYFSGVGNFSTRYVRNRYASDLRARGYRHGNVPRGWSKEGQVPNTGQTVVLDDRTERINIDELFSKLTTTCP